jgi:hypothetical protein
MARARLIMSERRTRYVKVLLTLREYQTIAAMARRLALPRGTYLRRRGLGQAPEVTG